jgi:hypothetical protein
MIASISEVQKRHNKAHKEKNDFVYFTVKKCPHDPTNLSYSFGKGNWSDVIEFWDNLKKPKSKKNPDFFFRVYPKLSIEESFEKVMLQMAICKLRMKVFVNIDDPSQKTKPFIEEYERKKKE